jgi:mono/diheme cytochrome c family protein
MITPRSLLAGGIVLTIATVAVVLIGVVVLLGPDTHANLGEPDPNFDRAATGSLGSEDPFSTPLNGAGQELLNDPATRGQGLFFANGCATCHGLSGSGGTVGPKLAGEINLEDFFDALRAGDGGMPQYNDITQLSDEDAQLIFEFLQDLAETASANDAGGSLADDGE